MQIKKMLRDFWETFKRDPNEIYYLGTVVTAQTGPNEEELIDGQQRFTTLWLIALAFERMEVKSSLSSFLKADGKVRLQFEIRSEVQNYLQSLADSPTHNSIVDLLPDVQREKPYLSGIAHASELIFQILPQYFEEDSNLNQSLTSFAEYIATRVVFVKNTAPHGTDLRKLFTTLNNSGVQLEQADILKSRLLEKLHSDKLRYSKIWESCENMDNYFEHSVKNSFQPVSGLSPDDFSAYDEKHFPLTVEANSSADVISKMSLAAIIAAGDNEELNDAKVKTTDRREVVCESIITFPLLLLHTLRIYLHEGQLDDLHLPFHSSNLLDCFKVLTNLQKDNEAEGKIKMFIQKLWRVRYAFDKHVVKWIEKDGERILGIRPVNAELIRGSVAEKNRSIMLQSMLYFTGNYNTQMWLSPYIKSLLDGKTNTSSLEKIDNYLSLSLSTDKQASWDYMSGIPLSKQLDYKIYLDGEWGTGFKHYWFYKLEYVLWKSWTEREHPQFKNYRITSRNSVEHICSQNDEYGLKLYNTQGRFLMHTFGNLTLLSVGQNSSYGNQDTGKKLIDHVKKPAYDSLKLSRFFEVCGATVSPENVELHQAQMLALLDLHYADTLGSAENDDTATLVAEMEEVED